LGFREGQREVEDGDGSVYANAPGRRIASEMFDRFTDRARKTMGLARQEALDRGHDYIGTEHILMGLVWEGSGTALDVLRSLDVDLKELLRDVQGRTGRTCAVLSQGQLPFTPLAKSVLKNGYGEARSFGHDYIGTEHLLMGLLLTNDTLASDTLRAMGVRIEDVREQVLEAVGIHLAARGKCVRLLGFEDKTMPKIAAEQIRAVLSDKGLEPATSPRGALVVAFAPERDPERMFEVGLACGAGRPVIVLHLPGEAFELEGVLSMDVDGVLPAQLERVLHRKS